ncbi:MAG: oxidoreductase [Bacteroidales bacterium]|nr:oxidoreductase [Bacteroidales bacterium]
MKKVVLITGASSGIGKMTALLLYKQGFTVYGAARRLNKMYDLKEAGINLLQMDVTDDDSMVKGINEIMENEKRIDVLINNAGYGSFGALEDVPLEEARMQFEVNVFGPARLIQLVLPHMRAHKSGRIINVSSMAGRFGQPHGAWYHATKFALEGLSDSLRMELIQFGIDVVVIQPGAIKTEWNIIAGDNLVKMSGNTAYKNSANRHAGMLERVYQLGSEPGVIAKIIARAVRANNPRTRYAAGTGAKPILFLRKILPDRIFDSLFLSQLN